MNLSEEQQQRLMRLNELDETRQDSFQHTTLVQQEKTKFHDRFIKKK
jgi:hypothetical protein